MKKKRIDISKYLRRLIVIDNNPEALDYKLFKSKTLIYEYRETKKKMCSLAKQKYEIEQKLKEFDIDPNDIL
jgi:hypothetical protein